jgi:hypothetical protein
MSSTHLTNVRSVEILAPKVSADCLAEFLENKEHKPENKKVLPFDAALIEIVATLGQHILKHKILRQDSASVALAYWMRRSQIDRLKQVHFSPLQHYKEMEVLYVPVGRVFHVAPANVDTLFMYSWTLSFLTGNESVVRVSGKSSQVVAALLECLNIVMALSPLLRERNRFVTYPHDDSTTAAFSAWCSHRVVWGGDETVAKIRQIALPPYASERVFGSKFSYALFSPGAVLELSETDLSRLVEGFFNDVFWFDQHACSSPHYIFWVGSEVLPIKVVDKIEKALTLEMQRRNYETSVGDAAQKINAAFACAVDVCINGPSHQSVAVRWNEGMFTSVRHNNFSDQLLSNLSKREVCGGGFVQHVPLPSFADLSEFVSRQDQTVTYFGFSKEELHNAALVLGRLGADRIVPVGQALNFSPFWDGFDLVSDFLSRVTVVR